MFCFQSPFTRTSRMTAETTTSASTSPSSTVMISTSQHDNSPPATATQSNNVASSSTTNLAALEPKRRGSEAISEGSGSSSIRFIDQVSISGGSSTDTLPGIRADYLETDPLSPDPGTKSPETGIEAVGGKSTLAPNNSMPTNNLERHSHKRGYGSPTRLTSMANIRVLDNDIRSSSPTTEQSTGSITKCASNSALAAMGSSVGAGGGVVGNGSSGGGGGGAGGVVSSGSNSGGGRWRRKLLLRLRSSDSSNSSNGEPCSTSPSPSPVSITDNSASTRSSSSSRHSNNTHHNNIYNNQQNHYQQVLDNQDRSNNGVTEGGTTTITGLRTSSSLSSRRRELPPTLIAQPEADEDEDQAASTSTNPVNKSPSIFTCSINDIPSLENGFSDPEDEEEEELDRCNYAETETEDGSSLPSSPAALAAINLAGGSQPQPGTTYYGFLSVNGGAMRQETTSTSSPQLSTGTAVNSNETLPLGNNIGGSLSGECPVNVGMNLKPDNLDASSCLPAARSCPNLEQQSAGCSSTSGSSSPSPSPGPAGPRFKPLEEGDIQVCYLNHTRTLVSKILSSKFLRRWETHHLYLNDACLSSRTLTGFLQQPVPYSSMSEVYAVARWDPTYKYCLRIVLPDGSLLLQAGNAYTRDQWYHSILWKKSIFKYQHLVSVHTREEIILRELKALVDFALWTPLQDERVNGAPLEAVAKLLEDPIVSESNGKIDKKSMDVEESRSRSDRRSWAEAVLSVAAPLLEKVAPPSALARALARLAERHPRSPLVIGLSPAITRCLKHTVDFGKSPEMRKLIQVFVAALYENNDGEQAIRDYIASAHGPGSDCPHPRILPNLVSICVAGIFHRFEVANRKSSNSDDAEYPPPLRCYLLVLKVASEYADWRPGLGSLLQPVPFPDRALVDKEVQEYVMLSVMRRLASDSRCSVHRFLLPIREQRPGWIHIAAPSAKKVQQCTLLVAGACPDEGALFGEMLTTLLGCCCRRKRFIASLVKQTWRACMLLGVRDCEAAQEALCLMLEWRLLPNEEHRLQVVSALQSTQTGKNRYITLCQRQKNLQELQQKGGPKKLTLPARATDADVAVILGGGALGNLECLTLAFTSVTSACAEQLIKLPALRYLNLWATQFGDAGLQMISEHLQKLQDLNLCETPVSDKGISTLASLTSLRKLNLNSTKLSAQTFESLKKRLPALKEIDIRYTEAW